MSTTVESPSGFPPRNGQELSLGARLFHRLDQLEKKLDRLREEDSDHLLTKEDVAERLQVSERTVDTLAASGELQKIKVRRCVRFSPQAVDAYVRRQARGKGSR